MEEIVQQDPHIKSVSFSILPPLLDLDTEIEYGLFPTLSIKEVKFSLDVLYHYVQAPIIQDDFEHHPERRIWVEQMEKQYGQAFSDYIHQNKLRGNAITSVNGGVSYLEDAYEGERKERVERLMSSIERLSENIANDQTPLQHKLNLLPLFDNTIVAYVSLFKKEG